MDIELFPLITWVELRKSYKNKMLDSIYAVVGLYFHPNDVIIIAKSLEPFYRGKLEISTVNQNFLDQDRLNVEIMIRGYAYQDAGTQEVMNNSSNFVKSVEDRQSLKYIVVK